MKILRALRCDKLTILNCKQINRSLSGLSLWNEPLSTEIKHKIEKHWSPSINSQNEFDESGGKSKEKYYVLSMFPYPSGNLHMGHVRVYTISDTIARFQRMNGKNVIHPIGFDAFGLPAENAAIDRKTSPETWTYNNINHMREQLKKLGCSFQWECELATCNPSYYKWTQDLFLKLYDAGLVYRKEALVNWDPIDKTVLADEQVDESGRSWRSGALVEKKLLKQWFVRTTRFAKDLLDGLNDEILYDWRDIIKLQRHWIGDCSGISADFSLFAHDGAPIDDFITLWTNAPQHLDKCKFVAIANGNVLAKKLNVRVTNGTQKLEVYAKNPLNDALVPIFVTDEIDFVDGSDSHVGVPSTNASDALFAEKRGIRFENEPQQEDEQELAERNIDKLKRLRVGGHFTSAKLKDWLISRQRYWGTPIPIVHCDACGPQAVPRDQLPVELPKLDESETFERGRSYLNECADWINAKCPRCRGDARRETDTMDTFVDSTWYYLRYLDARNDKAMFDVERIKRLTPVDLYIGGKEHAVLHLYYARFVSHFLHSLGMLSEREPFKRLLVQGMVMGRTFRVKGTGEYVTEDQVELDKSKKRGVHAESGKPVVVTWEKMSKSKRNGVDPSRMFDEYGIDTTRLLMLADVSPTSHRNWNSNTFPGILNWQKRLWLTIKDFLEHRANLPRIDDESAFNKHEEFMYDSRNFYVKGATFNYCQSQQISVAISKMQGLTNSIRRMPSAVFARGRQFERALATQIILLAPIAPHFASELWSGFVSAPNRLADDEEIRWDASVLEQKWPEIDMDYNLDLICTINGQEKTIVKVPRKEMDVLTRDTAIDLALKQKGVQEELNASRKNIVKILFTMYKGYDGVVNITTANNKDDATVP